MSRSLQKLLAQRSGAGTSVLNSTEYPLSAPVGGWNTRDALTEMPETDAIVLDNIIPGTGSVRIRRGHQSYATGMLTNVETLAELHAATTRKFIAAAGGNIYDITATGAATLISSGFTNARWQYVKFGSLVSVLWLCNGQDNPQIYDGTSLSAASLSGDVTATSVVGVHAFKNRLYLIQNSSQDFYYGGLNAVSGAFTKFPLSRVAKQGGNLVAIKSITRDGGDGADDLIAFFMSSGELIVYQGSDPGDSASWSLVGRFNIAAPIADRAVLEIGTDIALITRGDVVRLSDVMNNKQLVTSQSKLSGAISDAVRSYSSNYGWQGIHYPGANYVLFNIPVSTNIQYYQYGVNTITGAPFRFTGQNARCWGIYNNNLYFGGNGVVYKADTGFNDNGNNIVISAQTAFSFLGTKRDKQPTTIRPIIEIDGNASISLATAYDYGKIGNLQLVESQSNGSPWDTSPWDTSFWSPESVPHIDPFCAEGAGKTVSLLLQSSLKNQDFEWSQTRFAFYGLDGF